MELKQVAAVPEGDLPPPRKTASGGAALCCRRGTPRLCQEPAKWPWGSLQGGPLPTGFRGPPRCADSPGCSAPALGHGGTVSGLHVGPSGTNFLTLEIVEAPAP